MTDSSPRVAVVSTVVPPGPTGQARVLGQLLGLPCPENCLLLTDQPTFPAELAGTGEFVNYRILGRRPSSSRALGFVHGRVARLNQIAQLAMTAIGRATEIAHHVRDFNADVVVACTASPLDLPASLVAALRERRPLIVYLFDDPVYQWASGPLRQVARFFEPIWSAVAAEVIAPNEAMVEEFARRRGRIPVLIRNPIAAEAFGSSGRAWPAEQGRYRIVYTGSVYHAQSDAMMNLVRALEHLEAWSLHIYTDQSAEQVGAYGIRGPSVFVHPHVSQAHSYEVQRSADLLFLPLAFRSKIQHVLRTSAPMKMGEYLASGRPILAHAPVETFVMRHIRDADAGFVVDQPSPAALADMLRVIAADSSRRQALCTNALKLAQSYRLDKARGMFWDTVTQAAMEPRPNRRATGDPA